MTFSLILSSLIIFGFATQVVKDPKSFLGFFNLRNRAYWVKREETLAESCRGLWKVAPKMSVGLFLNIIHSLIYIAYMVWFVLVIKHCNPYVVGLYTMSVVLVLPVQIHSIRFQRAYAQAVDNMSKEAA